MPWRPRTAPLFEMGTIARTTGVSGRLVVRDLLQGKI